MGWLRKIGRKIDRGIRKVFGKNGWLKAAATVAALTFAAPIFGTQGMSFVSKEAATAAGKLAGDAAFAAGESAYQATAIAEAATAKATNPVFTSLTQATGDFFKKKGVQIKELPATLVEQGQDVVADTADSFIKGSITNAAMGSDTDDFGSAKGVQTIGASEQSAIQNSVAAYAFDYPDRRSTLNVPQVQPVFARLT
tara:strand:+ start:145 stop:735 length:591 start_codon:yes stop_codon:yes gene_type:complete